MEIPFYLVALSLKAGLYDRKWNIASAPRHGGNICESIGKVVNLQLLSIDGSCNEATRAAGL